MTVIGIDPGSLVTGYGILEKVGSRLKVLEYGTIKTKPKDSLPQKLFCICDTINSLLQQYKPQAVSLEKTFVAKYPQAALILGHVRGAVMLTCEQQKTSIYEYEPRLIKKSVTSIGSATKHQVAIMIQKHLQLSEIPKPYDVADALGIAYCHILRMSAM